MKDKLYTLLALLIVITVFFGLLWGMCSLLFQYVNEREYIIQSYPECRWSRDPAICKAILEGRR